ncbi:MAG: methylated-DNA--[protein]-cysteine S-methyltransferase [Alphaproteobacteria bacterium]|nr:methylated-DNA--[protein]-cysteine S-methyltransferase [Alphaproteobacteria bacterium]
MIRTTHDSPVGPLTLIADQGRLAGVFFENHRYDPPAAPVGKSAAEPVLDAARKQLDAYFAGRRRTFDLPLGAKGTAFQTRVWKALLDIPFGETVTYGAIAAEVGNAAAVRAVGGAVGRNPISIIVPCHRVIGADGTLTGFGGGLERKRTLLALERGEARLL